MICKLSDSWYSPAKIKSWPAMATTAASSVNSIGIRYRNRESLYRKNLERNFAPEFINRIDDIVTFGTLTEKDVLRIIDIELGSLNRRIADQGYTVEVNNATKRCLVREGYDPHYGVRSLKRVLLDKVEDPLAELIISGEVHEGDRITVDCKNGQIKFTVVPGNETRTMAS